MNYIITPIGTVCDECTIPNCSICYYDMGDLGTTLDDDFRPMAESDFKNDKSTLKCSLCNKGHILSNDKLSCAT